MSGHDWETKYHREIGFPDIEKPTGKFEVRATDHARRESNDDKYGTFNLPTRINLTEEMYERDPKEATADTPGEKTLPHVFEISVDDVREQVSVVCARTHYDEERDIILIIRPYKNTLVTAWINLKGDKHHSLNKDKYENPNN